MLLFAMAAAQAAPAGALGATLGASTTGQDAAATGRLRWESGWQLGLRAQAARITTGYVDGFPVTGARGALTLGATVPLVRLTSVQVDLEVDAGVQGLRPDAGSPIEDTGIGLIADVSPMVTVPLGEPAALRIGWTNVFHQQLSPSSALDAQGALIRAEAVWATGPDLQVTLGGTTGGVFGFDGDGGKYVVGARAGLRWVPGQSRTWKNH